MSVPVPCVRACACACGFVGRPQALAYVRARRQELNAASLRIQRQVGQWGSAVHVPLCGCALVCALAVRAGV